MTTVDALPPQPVASATGEAARPQFDLPTEQRRTRESLVKTRWWHDTVLPILAPVTTPVSRVTSVITSLGWAVLGATVVLGALGTLLGWWEFRALAWIGIALLAVCAVFLIGRTAYDAKLDLSRTRVVEGERAVGALELANPGRRALLPVQVELPVGKGVATFAIPRLGPGTSHEELFTIPTHRRAVLQVGPITAVRGDPLGVLARVVKWSQPVDLYVHPRTVALDGSSSGLLQDLEGLPSKELSNSDISFHALREYVPGDELRRVHWRSSARTGKLMVRQFEETRRSHLAVALSLNETEFANDAELELAVSFAGSLGLQAIKEDKQVSVMVQGATLPTKSGKPFLDSLSALDKTDARRGSVVDLALHAGNAVPDASVAVLVCGTFVAPASVRRAASHIPLGVKVVAIYCSPHTPVTRRMIGDVVVLTVGSLKDLPHAMRRITS
jgi:uncharacterized protein (DUF58 family)